MRPANKCPRFSRTLWVAPDHLTSRQSQRPQPSRGVLSRFGFRTRVLRVHAARRLWSWLIFDVRQNERERCRCGGVMEMRASPGLTNELTACGRRWLRSFDWNAGVRRKCRHCWLRESRRRRTSIPASAKARQRGCFLFGWSCRARDWQHWQKSIASQLRGARNSELAEQGARANAGIRHAACDRSRFEMKPQKVNRDAARGAPAPGVAHL